MDHVYFNDISGISKKNDFFIVCLTLLNIVKLSKMFQNEIRIVQNNSVYMKRIYFTFIDKKKIISRKKNICILNIKLLYIIKA